MYNVLLVDDEPAIREGLRTLIPWEELGFTVADTAANGREALLKHGLLRPDLMIVDIRMPGMDGLELIAAIRGIDPGVHILILSGYADFDYARQAIGSRVDGYLLKPVDEDELETYLRALADTLRAERERFRRAEMWDEMSKEQRILAALQGDRADDPGEGAGFGWHTYELTLVKLLSREEIDPIVADAVRREWTAELESPGKGVLFTTDAFTGVLLKKELASPSARAAILSTLRSPCLARGLDCAAASGGAAASWAELGTLYERALDLMKNRFYFGGDELPRYGDERPAGGSGTDIGVRKEGEPAEDRTESIEDKLYLAVDVGSSEEAERLLEKAGRMMMDAALPEQTLKTRFVQIVSAVLVRLAASRPDMQTIDRRYSVDVLALFREYRYEELLLAGKALFRRVIAATSGQGADQLVKRIVDLIQRNYQENLKLETIAELFHYNSAYLGKVFKQTTGEYFNTYLDKVRIAQAKALLDQGMKVYQVAEQVGYANVDYFHTKFRKYVGTSPTAYRKKD